MSERIALIGGFRTPFCKAGENLKEMRADTLGSSIVRELLARTSIDPKLIDELIFGNVAQPADAANIARVVALKAGLPESLIACTVHRNCASGMESVTTAASRILSGEADCIIAGGTESMSNIPLLFGKKMTAFFGRMMKAKTPIQKLKVLSSFRLSHLAPVIGVVQGLTDPVCGLNMGQTAEVLAREFSITREMQDQFALNSHEKALAAIEAGRLAEEIIPVPVPPKYDQYQTEDVGPRKGQSLQALAKLKPYFDRVAGTVTVGNACPITDGAAALLVTKESFAKEHGLEPLGYLRHWSYAGLEPNRMGLGPVYATAKLMQRHQYQLKDFKLVELNEAFSAQVLACQKAFESNDFAKDCLGQDQNLGELPSDILNVNGGAVALGHPVGVTGTRLIITLLRELKRRQLDLGLATLCIGGGQGAALALEVA